MKKLPWSELHQGFSAVLSSVNNIETVISYGNVLAEHESITGRAALIDLSHRTRIRVTGHAAAYDFLQRIFTNDIPRPSSFKCCYTFMLNPQGNIITDAFVFNWGDSYIIDAEAGMVDKLLDKLKSQASNDINVSDASGSVGILTIQGPIAQDILEAWLLGEELPADVFSAVKIILPDGKDVLIINNPRTGTGGFDIIADVESGPLIVRRLFKILGALDCRLAGWQAFDIARFEAGIPRFGSDIDPSVIATETGLAEKAISSTKTDFVGFDVISRHSNPNSMNSYLRGLRLFNDIQVLPQKGDLLEYDDQVVGYITSSLASPKFHANLAFGYISKDFNKIGNILTLRSMNFESPAQIVELPFSKNFV